MDLAAIKGNLESCKYISEELLDPLTCERGTKYESECLDCAEKARQKLVDMVSAEGMSIDAMLKDKELRNRLIKDFRRNSTLNLKDLGTLFGGLSESTICKILNK